MADLFPNRGMRFLAAGLGFIAFSGSLLLVVFYRFLIPAAELAKGMEKDAIGKRQLSAISLAVMIVVLVSLLGVLILMFRPIKSLLSNKTNPRTVTKYQDAWAEAGRRAKADDEPRDEASQE
jgi:asparagine N-glycosylation enzyme membrane subunit Stt3